MSKIFQLKVSLVETSPLVWRRFTVPGNYTLAGLSDVIQKVMGWRNSHLHQFEIAGQMYSDPESFDDDPAAFLDEAGFKLEKILPAGGEKFFYVYDFGDDWRHELAVENIIESSEKKIRPQVLGGERRCPPEDCGGPCGYADLLKIISDKNHPQYNEMKAWAGELGPDEFDIKAANKVFERS